MDCSLVGRMTAEMMERLEDEFPADDEGQLRTVMIVCEVDFPSHGRFLMHCSDDRPWVQQSFLGEACDEVGHRRGVLREIAEADEDDD